MSIKEVFKRFVHGYISSGHTVWDESEEEVKRLIDEWVESYIDEDCCFTFYSIRGTIDYVKQNISDDYKQLYNFNFDDYKQRYTSLLEKYLKHYIHLTHF